MRETKGNGSVISRNGPGSLMYPRSGVGTDHYCVMLCKHSIRLLKQTPWVFVHLHSFMQWNLPLLPPASKVCEGYVFTPVCQSFCSQGEGMSRPTPRGRLGGLKGGWGVQAHTQGVQVQLGVYPSMHWGRHPPPNRRLLLRTVRILLECILVFTL